MKNGVFSGFLPTLSRLHHAVSGSQSIFLSNPDTNQSTHQWNHQSVLKQAGKVQTGLNQGLGLLAESTAALMMRILSEPRRQESGKGWFFLALASSFFNDSMVLSEAAF